MFGQFSRQEETDCGLDFSRGDCGALVVMRQSARFGGDSLEKVVHKGVHDRHGFAGYSCIGMHLLQHLIDVDAVALPPLPLPLLVRARRFRLTHGLL